MKAVCVFALLAFGFILIFAQDAENPEPQGCPYNNGPGQPNCTAENIATGLFRNNWDPTAYWVCNRSGPAIQERCNLTGWLDSVKDCVPWSNWTWTPPCDPPNVIAVNVTRNTVY